MRFIYGFVLSLISISPAVVLAVGSNNIDAVAARDFILNSDNEVGDVALSFGGNLNEYLQWNTGLGQFEFSDDLSVDGNLSVSGDIVSLCGAHESFSLERGGISSNAAWSIGNGQTPWGYPMACSGTVTTMAGTCTGTRGTSLNAVLRVNNVATGCTVNLSTTVGTVTSTTCDQAFSVNDVVGVYAGTEVGAWTECVATFWVKYD